MSGSVVLEAAIRFEAIDVALTSLGFRRDNAVRPFTKNTISGEPEVAAWTRGDAGDRITYTFNPVVSLRVLACSGDTAAQIGAHLPTLTTGDIIRLLGESEPRLVLLGLLATRALGADELAGVIAPLRAHPDPLIRRAAEGALPQGEAAARMQALGTLKLLCEQAIPVVAALVGPDGAACIEALRPRDEDYVGAFDSAIVTPVRAAYELLWQTPPELERLAAGTMTVCVDAAPAGMLREDNELSRRFPGGYRALAPYLRPERIWFVWRFLRSGEAAGIRYDGLVRLPGRWVWFPKPYRVVGEILRTRGA